MDSQPKMVVKKTLGVAPKLGAKTAGKGLSLKSDMSVHPQRAGKSIMGGGLKKSTVSKQTYAGKSL